MTLLHTLLLFFDRLENIRKLENLPKDCKTAKRPEQFCQRVPRSCGFMAKQCKTIDSKQKLFETDIKRILKDNVDLLANDIGTDHLDYFTGMDMRIGSGFDAEHPDWLMEVFKVLGVKQPRKWYDLKVLV